MATQKSVAVLGAGLAGLAAATKLVENGHNVTVFEARNRPGGRVWSETIEAMGEQHVYERGAEFVLGDYSKFREYCAKYNLELVDAGMSYYLRQPADRPNVTVDSMAELGKRAAALAADPEFNAQDRSVADALNELGITGDVRDALEARIYISTAVHPDQVTAQHTLDHVASFTPGPTWRVGGGNQRLAISMADALGDRVRYGTVVEHVSHDEHTTQVTANGTTEEFDYVVVALPYSIVADETNPILELPSSKREALNYVTQGHAAKLHLPLQARPDTSAVMSVNDKFWTWTATAADGQVAPVLNCFVGEFGTIQQMRVDEGADTFTCKATALRSDLEFGSDAAILSTWHDEPFSRGAYSAHAPGFTSQHSDDLAAPVGRVHFSGEYVDPEQTGLMEGALRTGERAAEAITAAAAQE